MPPLAFLAADAIAIIVVVATLVVELRSGNIPNVLTLPLVPLAFVMCLRDGRWGERGIALVVAIAVAAIVFRPGGSTFGGGAVKLVGGLIVVLGPSAFAIVLVVGLRTLVAWVRRKPDQLHVVAVTPWVLIGCLLAAGADYLRFSR